MREQNSQGSSLMPGSQSFFWNEQLVWFPYVVKAGKKGVSNCLGPGVCDDIGQNFSPVGRTSEAEERRTRMHL
jgi:hypothetical protein